MTDWTDGYVADITYTHGYYPELNPLRMRLALLYAGIRPPTVNAACELGFGQGISINLHAATSATQWYGTDFNPAQAGFAQELAQVSGSNAHLFDEAFADFCARSDLPDFDFIGLHGIWSWISDDNRQSITEFIRRRLKVGGVLYISYNTQPGWAAMVPLRELLARHTEVLGMKGQDISQRIDTALDFAGKLFDTNPAFARANPQVNERLKKIRDQNRHYLAHEYFNRDWHPMSFARMSEWLAPAKIDYACSANYLDHIDVLNLTAEQQALLKHIPHPMFSQLVRDFCINQQFRRDFWVKGARRLSTLEQAELLRAERCVLVQPRAQVNLKTNGHLGEATLQETVYAPVLDALASHQSQSLAELEQTVRQQNITFAQLLQAVVVLSGNGALAPAQNEAAITQTKITSKHLNLHLMSKARSSNEISYLASPITGGGITIPRFQQLFMLAATQDHKTPQDWAQYVWHLLTLQGQHIIKEGKTLDTPEDNLAELSAQAQTFADHHLAILKALQVV